MKTLRQSLKSLLVGALVACGAFCSALAADKWYYTGSSITNEDGWAIAVGRTGTELYTNGNGCHQRHPALPDRDDNTYTLDLSLPIVDVGDTTKTYTFTCINYYFGNGMPAIGLLVVPETLKTVNMNGGAAQTLPAKQVLPKDFTHDIVFTGNGVICGINGAYADELHLNGITSIGNCGLTFTHGGVERIFFYETFAHLGTTGFANSNVKYDLYFRGELPQNIDDTQHQPNGRALIHVPQTMSWITWLADHTREFGDSDKSSFETKYPGEDYPPYVITSGKFVNGYATFWNCDPGVTVASQSSVGLDSITPEVGTYSNVKTGTEFEFSAPESVTEGGVEYSCEGYTLETAGASWDDAKVENHPGEREFTLTADDGKAFRVTWLWKAHAASMVRVVSNKGDAFGSPDPGYGTYLSFPTGGQTFTATTEGYEDATGLRYAVTGYKLTDKDGNVTSHAGQSFAYTTDMGSVTLEWQWAVNGYRLAASGEGDLAVTVEPALDAQGYGTGLYTVSVADGEASRFVYWKGNTLGQDPAARKLVLNLAEPVALTASVGTSWIYTSSSITNADGWAIRMEVNGTNLTTGGNGCLLRKPATPDRADGTYTLDMSGVIVDADDPTKTYSLTCINYYFGNGMPAIGLLVLPPTVTKVNMAGGAAWTLPANRVIPKDFTHDVVFTGDGCICGINDKYADELHLNGIRTVGNCGLKFTHGGIERIFFFEDFANLGDTTFAGCNVRYDLYFRGGVPANMDYAGWGIGSDAYLHVPKSEAWMTWIESNTRDFTDGDRGSFQKKFPGMDDPLYVINTSGKFNGGYLTFWNCDPGVTVDAAVQVGASEITPAYGSYPNVKTGTLMAFSAPESVTENGIEYTCEGYTLETAGASWEDAKVESHPGVRAFTLTADDGKALRVKWLWKANITASVAVSSNKGIAFGSPEPGYGLCTDFPGGARTFTATAPAYEDATGTRYIVTGYKLKDEDGTVTTHDGQSFDYTIDMGQVELEWQWAVNGYRIATAQPGYLGVTVSPAPDAAGFVGGTVTLTAVDGEYEFAYWSGNTELLDDPYARTITVNVTEPVTFVATPKCPWHYTGDGDAALTNVLGWQIRAQASGTRVGLGQDCVRVGASVPWKMRDSDGKTPSHYLDLSLPIIRDSDGETMTLYGCAGNVPFRRSGPYVAKLVLPTGFNYQNAMDGNSIFGDQPFLREIDPAPLTGDNLSGIPGVNGIPYQGDIYLRSTNSITINNCTITASHGKEQNLYFGKGYVRFNETGFTWGNAHYITWFESFPSLAGGRNGGGGYTFFVHYPGGNADWAAYIAANARRFKEADKASFQTQYPNTAAAGVWPKYVFTSGFFSGTWARPEGGGMKLIFR